ncbi:biliverdin-producing heme oxygenase [Luteimonas sp. Y-2-2-4F]|nr:biliverdin-producing heme oxygenase [Luteimonas sp. Y-2-2-4F]
METVPRPSPLRDRSEPSPTRSQRLKAATREAHARLDARIMAADPFADRARFARFLRLQYRFHRDVDGLYADPALHALLPDLPSRRRLSRIAGDLADLGQPLPPEAAPRPGEAPPLPVALGWLYVAEGSNLGGAILYRMAAGLGLDAGFGARHLAPHADGPARHWRGFTAALDAAALTPAQERQAIDAARDAFETVHAYAEAEFA